ncbi:MAG: tetratricopeptide repeat protein, partial [Thermoanaerobaculia bacterium]
MAKNRGPARTGQPSETWQVGAARLPKWMTRSDGEVCRAWMAVCVRQGSKSFLLSELGPEEAIPSLVESVISDALKRWRRPRRIQVPDPDWAPALESALAPRGLTVEVEADLPLLRGLLEMLPRRLAEVDPRPGALTGAGVTPDRLAALARAAAELMAASGWRHLNEDDLIRVGAPDIEVGLRFFTLSHAGGRSAPDLKFFPDAQAFEDLYAEDDLDDFDDFELDDSDFLYAGEEDFAAAEEAEEAGNESDWVVELLPPWAAPAEDVELWQSHGLPWAGEGFLPVAMLLEDRGIQRPDRRQVAFFEGLFAALAATAEEDLDAGRWEKRVSTAEGEVRFVFSLPGLLEPPGEPAPEPLSVMRVLERSMRKMGTAAGGEASPQDRAEDLLELAHQARGRRGVLLARQALEVWPDCADAYSFLASLAPDLESAARLYELGMAAGERAMGPEACEAAGYFWGILETRPYMRARAGLARVLVEQGRLGEAVEHYQEMLRLNPNDNQGLRHTLVNLLIELGRDEEAWRVADPYPEDGALLDFPRALLLFRREGDSPEARKGLKKAIQENRFVPGMLLGDREPPPRGGFYSPGEEDEAGLYLDLARDTWEDTEGALGWLRKRTAPPPRPPKRKGKGKRKK